MDDTVDLPVAMEPVRPMNNIASYTPVVPRRSLLCIKCDEGPVERFIHNGWINHIAFVKVVGMFVISCPR